MKKNACTKPVSSSLHFISYVYERVRVSAQVQQVQRISAGCAARVCGHSRTTPAAVPSPKFLYPPPSFARVPPPRRAPVTPQRPQPAPSPLEPPAPPRPTKTTTETSRAPAGDSGWGSGFPTAGADTVPYDGAAVSQSVSQSESVRRS